jgi:hypothetical protein
MGRPSPLRSCKESGFFPLHSTLTAAGSRLDLDVPSAAFARLLANMLPKEAGHFFCLPRRCVSPDERFANLMKQWKAETSHLSLLEAVYLHPAYQQIIGMGEAALPFIFKELADPTGRWFWALTSITGHEPFKGQRGIADQQMREAWLGWSREHGYA